METFLVHFLSIRDFRVKKQAKSNIEMHKYLFLDFSGFLVCYFKHLMQPVCKISSLCKFLLGVFLTRFD